MVLKEEMRIVSSSVDEVEETLTEAFSIEEANMTRAKVKMAEVREENERLRLTLSQIMKDYHSLKKQFNCITHTQDQSNSKKIRNLASKAASDDESDLVSLRLGRFSVDPTTGKKKNFINHNHEEIKTLENNGKLELGLNCKLDSDMNAFEVCRNLKSENSCDESKEEVRCSQDRSPKNSRSGDDEILQHNSSPLKKPRVSVRAVCSTQTMHDGCQWRKYGQKIAKGNPCPRAYYRCTVSTSCPVRKQVQRCIDDMSILVSTYEGSHDHPIPASGAAMASATSAAMAMLSCGSSSSSPAGHLNSNSVLGRASIGSSQSHPTVILDLTAPNSPASSTLFSSALPTSFNFSSSSSSSNKFAAINNAYSQLPPMKQTSADVDHNIAAATNAITHHPNFRSALAAAITSFVGNNNNNMIHNNGGGGKNSAMDFRLNFSQPSTNNINALGCAASFINRFPQ